MDSQIDFNLSCFKYDSDDELVQISTITNLNDAEFHFAIKSGELKCNIVVSICGTTIAQYTTFVNALRKNESASLNFCPGANQYSSISTSNGETTFSFHGAGGNNPTTTSFTIPNKYCLLEFNKLTVL